MAYEIGKFFGQIFGIAVGALVVALIIQFAANVSIKFKPPYGMAYKAAFLSSATAFVVSFVIGLGLGVSGSEMSDVSLTLIMVIGFSIQAYLYGFLIEHPDHGAIGFSKGVLVSLVQLVIVGGIVAVIIGILAIVS